jgi:hypothetical protein
MTKEIRALINRANAKKSTGAHDDRIEVMIAQTRAWIERSGTFDALGRSSAKGAGSVLRASVKEVRLTKQVLQFTRELEHLKKERRNQEWADSFRQPDETKPDTFDLASFGRTAPALVMTTDSFKVLSNLPPHKPRAVIHEMQA